MMNKRYHLKTGLPIEGVYVALVPSLGTIPRVPVMPDRAEQRRGLNQVGHYGRVRALSREYREWLLGEYFNPWAAAWFEASVYMWFAETYTKAGGGGGALPWLRCIITSDNRSAEDEVHELAHMWETAKVAEGLWTPQSFTELFRRETSEWALRGINEVIFNEADMAWARAFLVDPLERDPQAFNETFASLASRVMGDLERLPLSLRPYYQALAASL